jgi:two-component system chemotaxis response regulator CheB
MKIIVIGSSTGGPYILEQIFSKFPLIPAVIIIVQHLPISFTQTFCIQIRALTKMNVVVPTPGYVLHEGEILIAPAGVHMILEKNRFIAFEDGEKVHGVKPAVDKTMISLRQRGDDHLAGVVLTGMGQDGAAGIVHIRNLGGYTLVQDPDTAPIKSMPQSAIDTGKVQDILAPPKITQALIRFGTGQS